MLALFLAFLGPLATAEASSTNSSAGRLLDGFCVAAPSPSLLLVVLLCSPSTSVTPPSVGPSSGTSGGTCGVLCSDSSGGPCDDP